MSQIDLLTVNLDCKGTSEILQFFVAESIKVAQNQISLYLLFGMHVTDIIVNNLYMYVS